MSELQAPETQTLYRVANKGDWYCFQTFGEAATFSVSNGHSPVEVLCDDGWYPWNDSKHVCPICRRPGPIHEGCKEWDGQMWTEQRRHREDVLAELH